MDNAKFILTKSGYEGMKKELEKLSAEQVINSAEVESARKQGDLSENAEYHAARERQGQIFSRINEINNILNNCKVLSGDKVLSKVEIGAAVELVNLTDKSTFTVGVVSSVESNPSLSHISNTCPLGMAIFNKKVDDVCHVDCAEPYDVKIVGIESMK